jgi:hypothetical protein
MTTYWYDTEFIENGSTIDLISIGIVAEDGREYYAISKEFKPKKASDWVKKNVLIHLPPRNPNPAYESPRICHEARAWKKRAQIKADLLEFCDVEKYGKPKFWGYYSAYDHVALCQLFGTMMDLPSGWPMYTRDLKQWCDQLGNPELPKQDKCEHHALADARWTREAWRFLLGLQREVE